MHPLRTSLVVPLRTPITDLEPVLSLLHRFIQRGWVEGAVLDVADYRHVPDGPGVVLVGHDVDYGVEHSALRLLRKRSGDDLTTQTTDLLRMAAVFLEAAAYDGTVTFDADLGAPAVELRDRALTATLDEPEDRMVEQLTPVVRDALGPDATVSVRGGADPRDASGVVVTGGAATAAELVQRLGGSRAPMQSPYDISVERFVQLRATEGAVVVDVREDSEYATVNLGGTLLPLQSLPDRLDELDRTATVLVHCRAGLRGAKAVGLLREHGFDDAWNVNGGLVAWADRIDPTTVRY